MLIHWHTEADLDHLVRHFVSGCLLARFDRSDGPVTVVHSWGNPTGPISYVQHPLGEGGECESWQDLSSRLRADRSVVIRPLGRVGATLSTACQRYSTTPQAVWTWTDAGAGQLPAALSTLPRVTLYPRLPASVAEADVRVPGPPGLALAPDWSNAGAVERCRDLHSRLRQKLPGLAVRLLVDERWHAGLLKRTVAGADPSGWPATLRLSFAPHETVLFLGQSLEWGSAVLDALDAGCRVVAPDTAEYRELLAAERGALWRAGAGVEELTASIANLLSTAGTDTEAEAARQRRTAAWVRRWPVGRIAGALLDLVAALPDEPEETSPDSSRLETTAAPGGVRWCLRREIGIGDIVFTLNVAAALKARDPGCWVRLHTAPQHATWVRSFPQVDVVTTGSFTLQPGERTGDFEARMPHESDRDRSLALGELLGIVPTGWGPSPVISPHATAQAEACLAGASGLRLAFAPFSRTQASSRSLSPGFATEVGQALARLGTVIWLAESPVPPLAEATAVDLSGQLPLEETLAVLSRCDLLVSVDSGLLYLAASLRLPVVGLFTHIGALQRLRLAERFIALQPHLPCAPCGEGPHAFSCLHPVSKPSPKSPRPLPCLQVHRVEHVVTAAQAALAGPGREVWSCSPGGAVTRWTEEELRIVSHVRPGGG